MRTLTGRKKGSSSSFRKIRKLSSNNKTGDAYGITIPRDVAEKFSNINLSCVISGNGIYLESGCK